MAYIDEAVPMKLWTPLLCMVIQDNLKILGKHLLFEFIPINDRKCNVISCDRELVTVPRMEER